MNLLIIIIFIFNIHTSLAFCLDQSEETTPLLYDKSNDYDYDSRFINMPHEIKKHIFEYVDIQDIASLPQVNHSFHDFFSYEFMRKYEDLKNLKILQLLINQEQICNFHNPYKVIKLLSLLNRLHIYKFDLSYIDIEKIIKQCSLFRYSPIFLLLGGKNKLKNLCNTTNTDPAETYESKFKSLKYSIQYDHLVLPLIFISLTTMSLPLIIKKYYEIYESNKIKFNNLTLYNATSLQLPDPYNIIKCSKKMGTFTLEIPSLKVIYPNEAKNMTSEELKITLNAINKLHYYGNLKKRYSFNNINEKFYLIAIYTAITILTNSTSNEIFSINKTNKFCLYKTPANNLIALIATAWTMAFISFFIYKIVICVKKQKKLSILN